MLTDILTMVLRLFRDTSSCSSACLCCDFYPFYFSLGKWPVQWIYILLVNIVSRVSLDWVSSLSRRKKCWLSGGAFLTASYCGMVTGVDSHSYRCFPGQLVYIGWNINQRNIFLCFHTFVDLYNLVECIFMIRLKLQKVSWFFSILK